MQVSIGNEFFAKCRNDYSNWNWAMIREFLQNCIDAPKCSVIDIIVESIGDNRTRLTVRNNGAPMTLDVLQNKLLSLGGTDKSGSDSVGGFGKAKELLYFCNDSYEIVTGDIRVVGSGANYELSAVDYTHSTTSIVEISGVDSECLHSVIKKFISYCQWDGKIWLNRVLCNSNLHKGSKRISFDFGVVYTNRSFSNRMIVRVRGIPMFYCNTDFDRCVIIELNGSQGILTSNRDSLVYKHSKVIYEFIVRLSTDPTKALYNSEYVETYAGRDLATNLIPVTGCATESLSPAPVATQRHVTTNANSTSKLILHNVLDFGFNIKNSTGLKIPGCYCPLSDFSAYSTKLVKWWSNVLLEIYRLHDIDIRFKVGFIFSEDCLAQCDNSNGLVYYINPCRIVKNKSGGKSFKRSWDFTSDSKRHILSIAAHEYTHGIGYANHGETWGAEFTRIVGDCFANWKRFSHCFV